MTEYESSSLIISGISAFVSAVGLGVAAWALYYAGGQLKGLKEQTERSAEANELSGEANRVASLMAVLELENTVNNARFRVGESFARLSSVDAEADPKAFEFATMIYEEAEEQYLNATDRLCSCIIRGFVEEATYRKDYRNWIAEIVTERVSYFGPDSRHRNILKVHQAWSDDKSAKEI